MKQSDALARSKLRFALQVKWPLFAVGIAEQVASLVGNVFGDPVRRPRRFENIPDDGWEIALLNLLGRRQPSTPERPRRTVQLPAEPEAKRVACVG